MSKKYEGLAKDIINLIGGSENIVSLRHCQTRLRLQLRNNKKADKDALEKLDGVAKVMEGDLYQIVIGMHVDEVFEEAIKLVKPSSQNEKATTSQKGKGNALNVAVDFVSNAFTPVIVAFAGAGMVRALLALLVAFNLIDNTSQTFIILNMIGDATFSFIPILLAYGIAQKLNCNPILAMATAALLVHPTWAGLVRTGEPVHVFGFLPLQLANYSGSVIPIVLILLVQAPFEKWLNRVMPKSIRLVFVPMIVFLVMGILALSFLGPIGSFIGNQLSHGFLWLGENAPWAPSLIIGTTLPVMVIFGIHHGVGPIGLMSLTQVGHDALFGPGALCSNIAQGTSSLVVGLLSKNKSTRQIAISSGITALMGTTEPSLYGVNLPKKYPLVCAMIGGGVGGFIAGITGTRRFATGSSGLPAVPMYIGDGTMRFFYQIIISLVVTMVVTAVLTFFAFKKFEKEAANSKEEINI